MRILWYIFGFIFGTVVFVCLFSTPLFRNIDILFYRGVVLLLISTSITMLILFFVSKKSNSRRFEIRDVLLISSLLFSFNLVFFTLVPVTVDRSVTVFILEYIGKNRIATNEQMQKALYNDYILRQKAVERRFYEQQKSGTLARDKNGYSLTTRGKGLLSSFGIIKALFHIK